MKISIVSGGFDPIHSGHLAYLKSAREISDYLIVALNSDDWLINKKKKVFMPFEERKNILKDQLMHQSHGVIMRTMYLLREGMCKK